MSEIIKTVLLALAVALASSAHAEWKWEHFGTAPYASSRDEAMKMRESAFRKLGLPSAVVALLMEVTKKPGEKVTLKNGDKFDAQISKGDVVHGLKEGGGVVAFVPPKGMEITAPAEKWEVTWEGKIYTGLRPDVCQNWTIVIGLAPQPKPPTPQPADSMPAPKKQPPPRVDVPVVGTSACPNGFLLVANVWSLSAFSPDLRKKAEVLMTDADDRDSKNASDAAMYKPDAFSRTLGGQLRREVKQRAKVNADIRVLARDPESFKVVADIGVIHIVDGIGSIPLSDEQHKMTVETIWPASFISPVVSGGERRIELFLKEWKEFCEMHEHGGIP